MSETIAKETIVFEHAALDQDQEGHIILRGVLISDSLQSLKVDSYQREELPDRTHKNLIAAHAAGEKVPDIELAVRHGYYTEKDGKFTIRGPVFIVDGQQRVGSALKAMRANFGLTPRIGAAMHFETTEAWERKRFEILNLHRTKLAPSVILRNYAQESTILEWLHRVTDTNPKASFVLGGRVCWNQRRKRGEIMTAMTMAITILNLHRYVASGGLSKKVGTMVPILSQITDTLGPQLFKKNIEKFFETIDLCWGIKNVHYTESAPQIKMGFMITFARLIADHKNFWDGNRLVIEEKFIHKMKKFPMQDPSINSLSNTGFNDILYYRLRDHYNYQLRTRLELKEGILPGNIRDEDDEDGDELSAAAGG